MLEKITRGLSQSEPQPPPKVPIRQSVLRQPPAQTIHLAPIIETPVVLNPIPEYYHEIPTNNQPQQITPGIQVISPPEMPFPFPNTEDLGLGTFGREYRNLPLIQPQSPELAPITESLVPLSPGPSVIQQPRTPQASSEFGNMSLRSPDPQPPVMASSPGSQVYPSYPSHNYHGGYGSSHFTNTESYQDQNNGFRDVPDDILTDIIGAGEFINGLLSPDGHETSTRRQETSREGMVVADGVTKKKSSKSGRKESKSEIDESRSERKEAKSERKEMRRKVKEKREKEDVTRAMNQLKL